MLLEWQATHRGNAAAGAAAQAINTAIDVALADPATRTTDLGGTLGTRAFAQHVAALMEA
jgi:3-isopropylmalate dehydrogenase